MRLLQNGVCIEAFHSEKSWQKLMEDTRSLWLQKEMLFAMVCSSKPTAIALVKSPGTKLTKRVMIKIIERKN